MKQKGKKNSRFKKTDQKKKKKKIDALKVAVKLLLLQVGQLV